MAVNLSGNTQSFGPIVKSEKTPGPGAYNQQSYMGKEGSAFKFGNPTPLGAGRSNVKPSLGPGPAAYFPPSKMGEAPACALRGGYRQMLDSHNSEILKQQILHEYKDYDDEVAQNNSNPIAIGNGNASKFGRNKISDRSPFKALGGAIATPSPNPQDLQSLLPKNAKHTEKLGGLLRQNVMTGNSVTQYKTTAQQAQDVFGDDFKELNEMVDRSQFRVKNDTTEYVEATQRQRTLHRVMKDAGLVKVGFDEIGK